MAKKEPWCAAGGTEDEKRIFIEGPGTLFLTLDYDDVDHVEVDVALPEIVAALNHHWAEHKAIINKAIQKNRRERGCD